MIGAILLQTLRLALLLLLQVMILDHLDVANGYMVPYLYVLFLLMLPFELPEWLTLFLGALTGLIMDLFSSTPGMHMSACVVMAYGRIQVLRLLAPREGYEFGMRPTIHSMGAAWFITYAGVLILLHHLWLFHVELLRVDRSMGTTLRAFLSAAFTLTLALLAQFLTARPSRDRA
jgi:rod shape-determining protein MreD